MRTRALTALALLAALATTASAQPKAAPAKHALLVGCTSYPNHPQMKMLYGPVNDVKLWHATLTKNFGFPDANITKLVGWADTPAGQRPTRKNITAAFEALITKAEDGTHVVIALSGHGMQVPLPPNADPLDPTNYEPDGLDEVFLPADVESADKDGQIPNALKDDEIGKYLDRLRAKGAHVLIIFDCCHSGTMTRGGPATGNALPRVISRVASPEALGISQKQVADSVARAKAAVAAKEKETGKPVPETVKVKAAPNKQGGSLVAFYGAQPFEEAPEMPLPEDKPLAREFFHGLLTFSLNTTLQQRQAPLTYADMAQIMASQYRGVVGAKGPVPYAEGDLDREVLGYNVWPKSADILLTKDKDELTVNAGELRGITPGSILAVHPPANDPRDPKTVLGYLKVSDTTVASATVAPVAFDGKPVLEVAKLPDLARCSVAARDYGDMRVKLFVQDHPGLKAAFKALEQSDDGKEVLAMLRLTAKEAEADWSLRAVTAKEAAEEYGLKTATEDLVLLVRTGPAADAADAKSAAQIAALTGKPRPRRVYSDYVPANAATEAKDAANLAGLFARDLPKIFRWQNLWRVAGDTSSARGTNYGVKVEFARHATAKAAGPGEPVRGALPNGSFLDITITNGGDQNLWVVPLYLDTQMEIAVYNKQVLELQAGKSLKLVRGAIKVRPGEDGTEGVVVFLLPQTAFATKPDFKFIEQSPLRKSTRVPRKDEIQAAPKTPFGELLKRNVLAPGTRGATPIVETTPGVVSGSWTVTP